MIISWIFDQNVIFGENHKKNPIFLGFRKDSVFLMESWKDIVFLMVFPRSPLVLVLHQIECGIRIHGSPLQNDRKSTFENGHGSPLQNGRKSIFENGHGWTNPGTIGFFHGFLEKIIKKISLWNTGKIAFF